ncbi:Disease resistance protein [Quillaja saponaria]|uniref:Disease resistance protein n=1 Tax=Quillaja saponaria TaxID=32244 RepID=A0AAD7L0T9_QUISA|nr:Disease resistance protein [Quillaja saponaria]
MAEAVGGAFLSAFLQVVFDRLSSSKILDYFLGRKLNVRLLRKLEITLLSIIAVLDDAEEKQIQNPRVKKWVDEIKDVVFDAEDLLDEIEIEVSQHESQAELLATSSKVRNFSTSISAVVNAFDKEIESRIEEILDHLENLFEKKDVLGLKDGIGVGGKLSKRLPSTSLVDETKVFGRDDDKETVMKLLLADDVNVNYFSVIAIVAMGGMGKTTLAQLVYNDERVSDHFDIKLWICVSEQFDVIGITKTILEALCILTNDSLDLNMLQLKLKDRLVGKKFLLVLDDVWNKDLNSSWEVLQQPFNNGVSGSKILVTTRIGNVAKVMHSISTHHLNQLGEDDGWQLFAKHAFNGRDSGAYPSLEIIGRKIVEKCKGLPLAIKTLGGMLYTNFLEEEWDKILKSDIWNFSDDESKIIPALRLSYYYLPSHLKRCFSYCSIFPKDYEFDKEQLILMWMAEGFLQNSQKNKTMEETGEEYFHDLIERSFFQLRDSQGLRYVMHDLMNDLAKSISGEFCHRLEDKCVQDIPRKTRHLSFSLDYADNFVRYEPIHKSNRLRTFISIDLYKNNSNIFRNVANNLLSHLKYTRTLSLFRSSVTELPDSIGKLKHLRYLDISYTAIKKLPDSISTLCNLQTFKMRSCDRFLGELPKHMHKLMNLRHFDFRSTRIKDTPLHMGRLKCLQTLTYFKVGKCNESDIKQLGQLNQLRGALPILELQNLIDPTDAMQANLKEKEHLEELTLKWSGGNDDSQKERDILEKLQPHKNLKQLSVINYGGTRFPEWVKDSYLLPRIVSLELRNCKYCFSLPPLGQLPSLKELSISGFDIVMAIGPEFYSSGNGFSTVTSEPFLSLEILKFEYMMSWEEWSCCFEGRNQAAGGGAFPCLKELRIWNCPRLKEHLPPQLPSLKKLEIYGCQQLEASLPRAPDMCELLLRECNKMSLIDVTSFPALRKVSIGGSRVAESLLKEEQVMLTNTNCLEELYIYDSDFPNLQWPDSHSFKSLRTLWIFCCNSLSSLSLEFFPMLDVLNLCNCPNLETFSVSSVSEGQKYLSTSISQLTIWGCPKFVSLSLSGAGGSSFNLNAPKLKLLNLSNLESLKLLPEHMHTLLPSLGSLLLYDCPQLKSFLEGSLPSNLRHLDINKCPKLVVDSFPGEGLLPTNLTAFGFGGHPNLKTINYKSLLQLKSLNGLSINDCPNLSFECLPKDGLPKVLSSLEIRGQLSIA